MLVAFKYPSDKFDTSAMAVEIWPHVPPDQLKEAIESAEVWMPNPAVHGTQDAGSFLTGQKRELDWFVHELRETLTNIKHGLEDCYALLAPIEPGSTLVLSTPRNEVVKGHITRVGTRIVKGVRCPAPPRLSHAAADSVLTPSPRRYTSACALSRTRRWSSTQTTRCTSARSPPSTRSSPTRSTSSP